MELSRKEVIKDINENRNHSWIKEIANRHKHELNRVILDYFGRNITYKELFDEATKLAKALKVNGISKGSEFVVCIDRIPEYVYFMAAASIIGAKVNFISEKFNPDYIKTIIKNAECKTIFIQDYKAQKLAELIKELESDGYNIVTVSHKRSLPKDNKYEELLDTYYHHELPSRGYITYDEFVASGKNYDGKVYEKCNLDDPFTVTYSSGTTRSGFPEGIVHSHRHYITMGRYHDPEVSGLPSLRKYSTYSNIPSHSNSYMSSGCSDCLIMGGKVILDPVDDPNYFLTAMSIHESNVNIATPSMWQYGAYRYFKGEESIKSLPHAFINFAGGEQVSPGTEKFLNRFFRVLKCGIAVTKTRFSLSLLSVAGGDCEHGSVFLALFRALLNKQPYCDSAGMKRYEFVDVAVLRLDGTYCRVREPGRLVANSDCSMIGYNHDPESTEKFKIKTPDGKIWDDMKVYGYIDGCGHVVMKGRCSNDDNNIPCYLIADVIEKDTKKIMSCEVVKVLENDQYVYVAHIVPQYGTSFNKEIVLNSAMQRCMKSFGNEICDKLYFRIHDSAFALAPSGKRNVAALRDEGTVYVEKIAQPKQGRKRVRRVVY